MSESDAAVSFPDRLRALVEAHRAQCLWFVRADYFPATLAYEGSPPDAQVLGQSWRGMLREAGEIIGMLPAETAGQCVLTGVGELYSGDVRALEADLRAGNLRFHPGSIRGSFPQIVERGDA